MTRSPLVHANPPTCPLEAPGDTTALLFTHVTCPACREDGLHKGRDILSPRATARSIFTSRKKGRP